MKLVHWSLMGGLLHRLIAYIKISMTMTMAILSLLNNMSLLRCDTAMTQHLNSKIIKRKPVNIGINHAKCELDLLHSENHPSYGVVTLAASLFTKSK